MNELEIESVNTTLRSSLALFAILSLPTARERDDDAMAMELFTGKTR